MGTIDFLEYAVIKAPEMNNNDKMVAMTPNLGCWANGMKASTAGLL